MISGGQAHYALWFMLLVIAVGPALNEELFCRGFLGQGLVGRYGALIGVLITSVIFGVIHCNIPQGIWAFVLGCALHLAYLATRSFWVPVLLHFVNNAAATLLGWYLADVEPAVWQVLVYAVVATMLALVSGWALYRLRVRPEGGMA
jgi:membrane protease YdiL (CAAX protease family)